MTVFPCRPSQPYVPLTSALQSPLECAPSRGDPCEGDPYEGDPDGGFHGTHWRNARLVVRWTPRALDRCTQYPFRVIRRGSRACGLVSSHFVHSTFAKPEAARRTVLLHDTRVLLVPVPLSS